MIKIIQRKRYNTETAIEIHTWSNESSGRFEYREKILYRTKKGAWFLYHYGGPTTDMAISVGSNTWSGSEDIECVSDQKALTFLKDHGGTNVIDEYFSAD